MTISRKVKLRPQDFWKPRHPSNVQENNEYQPWSIPNTDKDIPEWFYQLGKGKTSISQMTWKEEDQHSTTSTWSQEDGDRKEQHEEYAMEKIAIDNVEHYLNHRICCHQCGSSTFVISDREQATTVTLNVEELIQHCKQISTRSEKYQQAMQDQQEQLQVLEDLVLEYDQYIKLLQMQFQHFQISTPRKLKSGLPLWSRAAVKLLLTLFSDTEEGILSPEAFQKFSSCLNHQHFKCMVNQPEITMDDLIQVYADVGIDVLRADLQCFGIQVGNTPSLCSKMMELYHSGQHVVQLLQKLQSMCQSHQTALEDRILLYKQQQRVHDDERVLLNRTVDTYLQEQESMERKVAQLQDVILEMRGLLQEQLDRNDVLDQNYKRLEKKYSLLMESNKQQKEHIWKLSNN